MFDDPIEEIDAEAIRAVVLDSLDAYIREDSRYENAVISDVVFVGSVADEERDFVPHTSNLDLVVSVRDAKVKNTVLDGFANYLREERAAQLVSASNLPVTGIDVGVYDSRALTKHIDDDFGFSCSRRATTPITMLQESQTE